MLYSYDLKTKTRHTIYELYTQPLRDHLRFVLFRTWWWISWKTRIEDVQDWVYARTHDEDEWFNLSRPSIRIDLNHHDYDVKNQTVLGRIKVERTET